MIAFRALGVLCGLDFAGRLTILLLPAVTTGPTEALLWTLLQLLFMAGATVILFLFPDRIAALIARRIGPRFSGFAYAAVGVRILIEYFPWLVTNISTIGIFGPEPNEFERIWGAYNDPLSIAIQVSAILVGVALVVFAKNFAEWTDWDWWRQRAFEDAQR